MHIAYIHQHFATPAQSEGTRSYEFARALIAAGHRVTMVTGRYKVAPQDMRSLGPVSQVDVDGIDVRYVNVFYNNAMGPIRRWMAFKQFVKIAKRVTVAARPDIVFATSTPLTVAEVGRYAGRKLAVPFVFEVRDIWPKLLIEMGVLTNPLAQWLMRRMELAAYRAAAHIVILAPGMEKHICATGVPEDRITFIPNSCDLEMFRPDAPPSAQFDYAAGSEFKLAFTGAHGRANGLDAVLDAAAELKRRGAGGIQFLFIGDGGRKPALMARAEREQLGGLARFVPNMPKTELAKVLPHVNAGMQILANVPGFYDGTSPNKFFDYIASGLPVLTNYPGWLAEQIRQNKCGLPVPPDDPKAFADAVLYLRDHPAECRQMGVNGRALAEREFSRTVMSDRFVHLLEGVAAAWAPR